MTSVSKPETFRWHLLGMTSSCTLLYNDVQFLSWHR